jgi:hypothetical protein
VDVWDLRSNSCGDFVDIDDTPIRERVGKRPADGFQWSAPWLSLSPSFASSDAIDDLVGAGLPQSEA